MFIFHLFPIEGKDYRLDFLTEQKYCRLELDYKLNSGMSRTKYHLLLIAI